MDQQPPISDTPHAHEHGGPPPLESFAASGWDMNLVAQLDRPKASEPVPSIGQFLSALDRTSEKSLAQHPGPTAAKASEPVKGGEDYNIIIDHHYLDNDFTIRALEARNPSYTTSAGADGSHVLNNVSGLSLTFDTFGKHQKLAIKSITIKKDDDGNKTFAMQVDNPLPPETQKVFNTPATVPLTFTMDAGGKLTLPNDSQLLYSLSTQSNTTLPGMVLRDALNDAGSVAQFLEKHPAYANNILGPFMNRFGADLRAEINANPGAPGSTADTSHQTIGRIMHAATNGRGNSGPSKILAGGDYHETMQIDGRERTFTVHVPPSYDPTKPTPMLLMVHGLSQTGASLQDMMGSNKVADREGFIAVYPDSVNWYNIKDLRTWNSGNGLVLPGEQSGDIQFMDSIIKTAKQQMNVDPMQVFMVGHSNGGMFTYAAAGPLSGELAGIGILSSAMSGQEVPPREPLSMINVHGTIDNIIPIDGLTDTPPVLRDAGIPVFQPSQYGTDYYKKLDGITAPYTVQHVGKETISTASNWANGTAVEQITIDGANHIFNNYDQVLEQVWGFLKNHPRQTPVDPKDVVIKEPEKSVESLTTVQQLRDDVKRRGVGGIEQDVDNIYDAVRTIGDHTISPSAFFDKVSKSSHVAFTDPVTGFIQNTTSISKKQDHIAIDRKLAAIIPINVDFGVGDLKSLEVGKVSFDLAKNNGYPELKNINGLTLHAQVAGFNLSGKINDISELPDGNNGVNGRIYRGTIQNPLPGWMRTTLLSPSQFNVDLKFDNNFSPMVVNQNTIERQLLGKNPWVNGVADEAQDAVNLASHFSLANTFKAGSDVGITAGATYLGYRLAMRFGDTRAKIAATVCFVAAPMAIDFIRKEFAT